MTTTHDAPPTGPDLPTAAAIREIIARKKRDEAAGEQTHASALEEEKKHQLDLFLARKLTPDLIGLIMARVHAAADSGILEIMIGEFPSAWCTDGGRRINNPPDDTWPETLPGIAREFFDFWERELKPRGFGLRAEIISYPEGKLGDVGAFLSWAPKADPADATT